MDTKEPPRVASPPGPVGYPIVEVEVTPPLAPTVVPAGAAGVALVMRHAGRPIGFVMVPRPADGVIDAETLARLIGEEAGTRILQARLRADLLPRDGAAALSASLTVAVCSRDRPADLARCLESVLRVQRPARGARPRFEVLVVDNAPSDDRTAALAASLPGVRYVREPRPGLDFARNRAAREAGGDFLAFLDDDVTMDRHWLDGLHEARRDHPDAAVFTGLVLPYELATEAQCLFERRGGFRRGFDTLRYRGQTLPGNPCYPCGAGIFGAGCNMTFRRRTLLELGGFDEALDTGPPLPGGGDLDIFYRAIRAGHALVYEPRLLVFHRHRRERPTLRRQYWTWGLGFMAFVAKSYAAEPSQRSKFRTLLRWWFEDQLRQVVRSVRGRHALPVDMVCAELMGGLAGLAGAYSRSARSARRIRERVT